MTEAELNEAALTQCAQMASYNHPLVRAITDLISAHDAVMRNGGTIDILRGAQVRLAIELSRLAKT